MSTPTRLGDLLPQVVEDLAERSDPTDLIAAADPSTADLTSKRDRFDALEHATRKAKEWAELVKDLQAEIKEAMGGEDGTAEVAVIDGRPVARWTRVKSNRFNQSAFKKADPTTYALFVEVSESRRFTLVDES